jgi:hypothetical protein
MLSAHQNVNSQKRLEVDFRERAFRGRWPFRTRAWTGDLARPGERIKRNDLKPLFSEAEERLAAGTHRRPREIASARQAERRAALAGGSASLGNDQSEQMA